MSIQDFKFDDDGQVNEEQVKLWSRVGAECVIEPHQLSQVEKQAVDRLIEESRNHHRLRGTWSPKDKLIVVQLLDTQLIDEWRTKEISCLPWGWAGGTYGGSLTLLVVLKGVNKGSQSTSRASIFLEDPMLSVVRNEPFVLVVAHGKQVVRSDRIDYGVSSDAKSTIAWHVDGIAKEGARGWIDPEANFWETIYHQTTCEKYLTASDLLSVGWFEQVEDHHRIKMVLATLAEKRFGDICRRLPLDDEAIGFVEAIENCDGDFRIVRDYLLDRFSEDRFLYFEFLENFVELPDEEEKGYPFTGFQAIMHTFRNCAAVSRCGQDFPWLNIFGQLASIELEPREFPEHVSPREYWKRHNDQLHFGWGYLLGGSDVPVSRSELKEMLPDLPTCDDAKECEEQANFLLAEADANKQGCIPPNAVVQLSIGPFASMELREVGVSVLVALRQANGLVVYFTAEPQKEYFDAILPHDEDDSQTGLQFDKSLAAIKLLVAAVIRDFWVVEHREAVFERRRSESSAVGRMTHQGPRIVYLPRVKYDYQEKPDVASCADELDTTTRRSHLVTAHLRKSPRTSQHQLALARRYGFSVPEGYTFVRPHERGKSKRDVIYRSRSALQSLYTATEAPVPTREVNWFRFERDVQSLMQNLGFAVEHVAASRRGDHGVDVYATKGEDLDAIRWVIQCKCWKPKHKVSPSVVRELVGTLTSYPQGTRGMIVTTSDFTSGSVSLAAEHDIRLMNGEEFGCRILGEGDDSH